MDYSKTGVGSHSYGRNGFFADINQHFAVFIFNKTVFHVKNFLVYCTLKENNFFHYQARSQCSSNCYDQQTPRCPFTFCYLNLVGNSASSSGRTFSALIVSFSPCYLVCSFTENRAERTFLAEPNFAASPPCRCAAATIERPVVEIFPQPWNPSHLRWTSWRERF